MRTPFCLATSFPQGGATIDGGNFRTSEKQQQHWNVKVNPFFVWRQLQVYVFFFVTSLSLSKSKAFLLIKIDKRTAGKGNSGQATAQGQPYDIDPTQHSQTILGQRQHWLHFTSASARFSSVQFTSVPSVSVPLSLSLCSPPSYPPLVWTVWYAYFPFSILAYASFCFCFISGACQIVKNLKECSRWRGS